MTGIEMLEGHAKFSFERSCFYMPILLDLAKGMTDKEHRKNDRRGCLTILSVPTGEILFTIPFGECSEVPPEKWDKYFELSQEKATRLFSQVNMHLPNGHTSSFESRNEEEDKYGGAIYSDCHHHQHIFSFSGMPELIDEAMMLVLAKKLAQDTGSAIVTKIEALERNPYWKELYEKFYDHSIIKMEMA